MATIKFSAIGVTDARGTSGGTTFTKSRAGAAIRRRVVGINPRTNVQTFWRARFAQNSQGWRALTAAQRLAWNTAAASGQYPLRSLLGDPFNPTGAGLYSGINNNIISAGGTAISMPPLLVGLGEVQVSSLTGAAGTPALSLIYTGTLGADERLVIFASYGLSPGRAKGTNFKKLTSSGFSSSSPLNLLSSYTAVYGNLVEGTQVFVRAHLVNETTGENRLAGQVSAVIAA